MKIEDVFSFIVRDIHTVVAATADEDGLPVTCAIDIMDWDGSGLYFLTARGKSFYRRLMARPYVSFTGIQGEDTIHRRAVTVRGSVRPESSSVLARLIERNAYMREIYPTERSREALEAFCIHSGTAEWFDLFKKPIERFVLGFGGDEKAGADGGGIMSVVRAYPAGNVLQSAPRTVFNWPRRPQQSCRNTALCAATAPPSAPSAQFQGGEWHGGCG